ncbi:MAG: photosystem II stability/assembly factor-like uncharacterized protein [Bermanella sp.]
MFYLFYYDFGDLLMRPLFSVPAIFKQAFRLMKVTAFFAAISSIAIPVNAEWKDPLETPARATLKATSSLLLDIIKVGERLVAVGGRGHIIFSDDEGFTWKQASVPVISTLTSVFFINSTSGWAVGHDAVVLHTKDSGETWVKQFDGFEANEMVLAQAKANKRILESELSKVRVMGNSDRIYEVEEQLENATFALEDALADFEDRSTKPLLDLWFKNSNEGFVVGAYGMVFKTLDGGQSWKDWTINVENLDRFHINSIVQVSGDKLMMVGEAGLMLRTTNGGDKWEQMFSPYEGSFFGITSLTKQGIQVAYGLRGNLARTEDFGSNWRLVDTGTKQTLIGGTDRLGRVIFIVGNGGGFLRGFDFARKWESKIRVDRANTAAIIESNAGHFVIVGENGVQLLNQDGELLPDLVKSI